MEDSGIPFFFGKGAITQVYDEGIRPVLDAG